MKRFRVLETIKIIFRRYVWKHDRKNRFPIIIHLGICLKSAVHALYNIAVFFFLSDVLYAWKSIKTNVLSYPANVLYWINRKRNPVLCEYYIAIEFSNIWFLYYEDIIYKYRPNSYRSNTPCKVYMCAYWRNLSQPMSISARVYQAFMSAVALFFAHWCRSHTWTLI